MRVRNSLATVSGPGGGAESLAAAGYEGIAAAHQRIGDPV